MNILDVFKRIGKTFARVGRFVSRFISDAQIDIAVDIVTEAGVRFADNDSRRTFAVSALRTRLGVPESIARWLVETAVLAVKSELAERVEQVGEILKDQNDDAPTQ